MNPFYERNFYEQQPLQYSLNVDIPRNHHRQRKHPNRNQHRYRHAMRRHHQHKPNESFRQLLPCNCGCINARHSKQPAHIIDCHACQSKQPSHMITLFYNACPQNTSIICSQTTIFNTSSASTGAAIPTTSTTSSPTKSLNVVTTTVTRTSTIYPNDCSTIVICNPAYTECPGSNVASQFSHVASILLTTSASSATVTTTISTTGSPTTISTSDLQSNGAASNTKPELFNLIGKMLFMAILVIFTI